MTKDGVWANWPVIVGITGYARAGKDSASQALQRLGYQRRAMADPLKDLALAFAHTQYPDLHNFITKAENKLAGWEEAKVLYPSTRQLLIDVGMAGREVFGEDFWVRMAVDGAPKGSVFTDCRFVNEAELLDRKAAELLGYSFFLRVERPGVGPASDFEREVPKVPVDAVVINDGSLDDLEAKVLDAFHDFTAARLSA